MLMDKDMQSAPLLARLSQVEASSRLHRLELDGAPVLLVERWQGWERLLEGFCWHVDVLSADASLPVSSWLGRTARLLTRCAEGADAVRSGLVSEAACVGADGGLARYRLTLSPWTWLLEQGRHSRVWQERGVLDIVASVFADYAPLASWKQGGEVASFMAQARARSYCVQYRESDRDFVSRLLAEEGLGWRLEEDAASASGHVLVLFADSAAQAEDASSAREGGVRFHRSDAAESTDAIQALGRHQRLGPARLTLLSHDYKSTHARAVQLPLATGGVGEAFDVVGSHAFASVAEGERHANLLAQAGEARRLQWQGLGTVRTLRAGTWLRLTQAGEAIEVLLTEVEQAGVNNLPSDLRQALEQALGPAVPPQPLEPWVAARAEAVGYAQRFRGVDRALPWRPVLSDGTGLRLNPRPTAPGRQTAVVVGAGEDPAQELHCDALGRVKVRFHWQRGARADEDDSCWLRVVQRYAGPGVGSQFLPRIGQEVVVVFLDGDIDRPVVLGAVYNGRGEAGVLATPGGRPGESERDLYAQARDARSSAQGNLAGGHAPPWHGMGAGEPAHRNATALWGVQSKEWGGSGYSRLLFDDSDGQLRVQLATTQGASQLNQGHLIHQADNYRGSFRGEGFELRSEAWGAVRATSGLWLSAYGHGPGTPAGEAVPQGALLAQLRRLGQTFSQAAATHLTVKLASHEGARRAGASQRGEDKAPLEALRASARTTVTGTEYGQARGEAQARDPAAGPDRVPHTGDALLGLAAPAGIGVVAGQCLDWQAGQTLTLASGRHSDVAIAGDLRLHAGQAIGVLSAALAGQEQGTRLSLVTGEGELDVQAQQDQVRLQSKETLKVVSANAEVELAAGRRIHLATAGGASVTLEGGNITFACPGEIKVLASKKSFVGPASLPYGLLLFPQSVCVECMLKAATSGAPFAALQ